MFEEKTYIRRFGIVQLGLLDGFICLGHGPIIGPGTCSKRQAIITIAARFLIPNRSSSLSIATLWGNSKSVDYNRSHKGVDGLGINAQHEEAELTVAAGWTSSHVFRLMASTLQWRRS